MTRTTSKKWQRGRTVTLPERMPYGSDLWIWHHYSLMMLINRHVADYVDDDTVSEHLQHVRRNIPLPYYDY